MTISGTTVHHGAALKLAVVGPSISRKRCQQGNAFRRWHSWACDEACELSILESEKVATALTLLERLPPSATLLRQPDKTDAYVVASRSDENHSTSGGSGEDEQERSSAGDYEDDQPTKGDMTVWPDTDSDDGFCSAWEIRQRHGSRRGSLTSEYGSSDGMLLPDELADEAYSCEDAKTHQHAMSTPQTPEPRPRIPIKVRNGMVIDSLTTLMIRNLPTSLQQEQLIVELDGAGFAGLYDFCHLPVMTATGTRKGYAFVNMIDTASAEKLSAAWHKTRQSCLNMKPDDQALDIVAANVQGFEANVAMLNEPRKRREGKSVRSAKPSAPKSQAFTQSKNAAAVSKVAENAPSVPPGNFHNLTAAAATSSAGPSAPKAVPPGICKHSHGSAADPGQSQVLSILGLADASGGMTMHWTGPACGLPKACASASASAMVLSVAAPGFVASMSVPR